MWVELFGGIKPINEIDIIIVLVNKKLDTKKERLAEPK